MPFPDTQIDSEPGRTLRSAGCALLLETRLLRGQSRDILQEHLDRLRDQLTGPEEAIDTSLVCETLLDLSDDLGSRTSVFQSSDYRWILQRLTRIYAQGFIGRTGEPFTVTAAAYAQVIETISHIYPGQDYSEAIGQLFCYMSRLFRTRERSWKVVYKHILSIPDAVEAKQLLNRAFFVEIKEWAEAGVDNLFSIRRDLYEKIDELQVRIDSCNRQIAKTAEAMNHPRKTGAMPVGSNVIDLQRVRNKRRIASLEHKRQGLVEAKNDEESIVALIESDIREFEEKLRRTRRAYFVRPV